MFLTCIIFEPKYDYALFDGKDAGDRSDHAPVKRACFRLVYPVGRELTSKAKLITLPSFHKERKNYANKKEKLDREIGR